MKCPFCNKEIPDGSAYCNHCGSVVPHVAVQEDPPAYNSVTDFDSNEKKQPGKLKNDPILMAMLVISLTVIGVWLINKTLINTDSSSDDSISSSYDDSSADDYDFDSYDIDDDSDQEVSFDASNYEPDDIDKYIKKKTKGIKKKSNEMVDTIGFLAKDDAKSASKEEIGKAIAFIRDMYPSYHASDAIMLKTMYYGYLLEFSFHFTDPRSALGEDAEQVVKYVYRGYDSIDDYATKSNLEQIKKDLSKIN